MTPDQKERERALDPSQSFIVEAPAGSGKTGLLVHRFLRLLSVVERPESVVAMTFTRKAAAEMKERVQEALRRAQAGELVEDEYERCTRELALQALERDRKMGWSLLDSGSRLQIQTIDSLCAMLTRQMPVVSEFGGVNQVIEDATELYRIAARRTLRDLAEGDKAETELFRAVSLHFDNDMTALETQITRMLQKRDQWHFAENPSSPLIAAFCHLLARAHENLMEVFRRRSVVDFTEVTRAATKALGTPERPADLLYWLDYRIEHLLVDEFQDTSLAQYQLIDALTAQWSDGDGHTLFLVGDPMQSIYRFREAEVALFLQCWNQQRLGSVRLNPVRLTVNFRSTPEILDWVKTKFSSAMREEDEVHGAVQFRPAAASRPKSKVKPQIIRFFDDNGEREAAAIVKIVERAKQQGSVAILARSRTHLNAILPALRTAEISYQAVELDQLKEQQHILDLISLTRAILHIGDRVSWLACLRAPWCGLTLDDLSALAEGRSDRTILDLLSDAEAISRLSPEGRSRAVRLQEILSDAVESVGRFPLRSLVEQIWVRLGGPAILQESNRRQDADTYFDLIESFEEGGIIRDFSLLNQRLECLYAKPSEADRVQVMTIHQAKGLEFDTVIIPQLGRGTRSVDRDLLLWTEQIDEHGNPHLLVAAQPQRRDEDPDYNHVLEEIKKKEAHEDTRLFYVACTRARNELYLSANVQTKRNGTECSDARKGTFLHLIWDSEKAEFESELRRKVPLQKTLFSVEENALPKTTLHRLAADWRAPSFDASVQWHPEFRHAAASQRKVTYEWAGGTARHAGTVVHELLKRIAQEGVAAWNPERVANLRSLVKTEFLRLGVPRSEEPAAFAQVQRALVNTLRSERGQWILRAHPEARSEWPITGRIQDTLVDGTIDRVFRDEGGRLWIVDFKTSDHKGGGLDKFLAEEQRRYRPQLDNYAVLMSRLAKGPISLGLYFPLLDAWREWEFEKEAALGA